MWKFTKPSKANKTPHKAGSRRCPHLEGLNEARKRAKQAPRWVLRKCQNTKIRGVDLPSGSHHAGSTLDFQLPSVEAL